MSKRVMATYGGFSGSGYSKLLGIKYLKVCSDVQSAGVMGYLKMWMINYNYCCEEECVLLHIAGVNDRNQKSGECRSKFIRKKRQGFVI